MPAAAELAQRFVKFLRSQSEVTVRATTSIIVKDGRLPDREDPVAHMKSAWEKWHKRASGESGADSDVEGRVFAGLLTSISRMTPTSFHFEVWESGVATKKPLLAITLSPDPEPTITESHWRSLEKTVETVQYAAANPYGIDDDIRLASELLDSRFSRPICATAEFYRTWLGDDSPQAAAFKRNIARASLKRIEDFAGRSAFYLTNESSGSIAGGKSYRVDEYWVETATPHRVIGHSITRAFQGPSGFFGEHYRMMYDYE